MNCKLEVTASFTMHVRYLHFVCLSRCRRVKYYPKVMGKPYYPLSFEASLLKKQRITKIKFCRHLLAVGWEVILNLFKKQLFLNLVLSQITFFFLQHLKCLYQAFSVSERNNLESTSMMVMEDIKKSSGCKKVI